MPDCPARLWILQANSDLHVAEFLSAQDSQERTYCQVVAKCQQSVEKSVKALAAGLRDANLFRVANRSYYDHDVEGILSAIRRMKHKDGKKYYQGHLTRIMGGYYSGEIRALSSLVPKKPDAKNPLHGRNTEYPYEVQEGIWTAPAIEGASFESDVQRFLDLARRTYDGCKKMVSVLERSLDQ